MASRMGYSPHPKAKRGRDWLHIQNGIGGGSINRKKSKKKRVKGEKGDHFTMRKRAWQKAFGAKKSPEERITNQRTEKKRTLPLNLTNGPEEAGAGSRDAFSGETHAHN